MNIVSVLLQTYGKRDRMNTGHNPTETAKGKRQKVPGKSDRNAAKMKTAAKVAKDKARRGSVLHECKQCTHTRIHYTHNKLTYAQI